jgi:transcriptional regulator with XRE-family HTH domain
MSEAQIEQLARVLKILIRFSKIQSQEIEKRLGFSAGYMSRLLGGKIDIKISHVLDIAAILGLHPQELFAIAFPQTGPGPSPGLQNLQKMLPHLVPASFGPAPEELPAPAGVDLEQLHEKLEAGFNELLQRVLGEMGAEMGSAVPSIEG